MDDLGAVLSENDSDLEFVMNKSASKAKVNNKAKNKQAKDLLKQRKEEERIYLKVNEAILLIYLTHY